MAKKKAVPNGDAVDAAEAIEALEDPTRIAWEDVKAEADLPAPAVEPPKPDNWISLSGFINPS